MTNLLSSLVKDRSIKSHTICVDYYLDDWIKEFMFMRSPLSVAINLSFSLESNYFSCHPSKSLGRRK